MSNTLHDSENVLVWCTDDDDDDDDDDNDINSDAETLAIRYNRRYSV
jgi:hypothetical protein